MKINPLFVKLVNCVSLNHLKNVSSSASSIAGLNDLDVFAANISNVYLYAAAMSREDLDGRRTIIWVILGLCNGGCLGSL